MHCKGCGRRRLSATDGYGFDGREPRTRAVPVGMTRQKLPGRADDVGAGRRNADPRPADRRGRLALRRGRAGTIITSEIRYGAEPWPKRSAIRRFPRPTDDLEQRCRGQVRPIVWCKDRRHQVEPARRWPSTTASRSPSPLRVSRCVLVVKTRKPRRKGALSA
jgi:hypothetical protein